MVYLKFYTETYLVECESLQIKKEILLKFLSEVKERKFY